MSNSHTFYMDKETRDAQIMFQHLQETIDRRDGNGPIRMSFYTDGNYNFSASFTITQDDIQKAWLPESIIDKALASVGAFSFCHFKPTCKFLNMIV